MSLGTGLGLDRGGSVVRAIRTTYESNFTLGSDGWSTSGDGGGGTIASNQTVAGETGCLKFTFGSDKTLVLRKGGIVDVNVDKGAAYSVSFKMYVENTDFDDEIEHLFGNFVTNNEQFSVGSTDAWVDVSLSGVAALSGWSGNAVGFSFNSGNDFDAGDFVAIKDYKVVIYE